MENKYFADMKKDFYCENLKVIRIISKKLLNEGSNEVFVKFGFDTLKITKEGIIYLPSIKEIKFLKTIDTIEGANWAIKNALDHGLCSEGANMLMKILSEDELFKKERLIADKYYLMVGNKAPLNNGYVNQKLIRLNMLARDSLISLFFLGCCVGFFILLAEEYIDASTGSVGLNWESFGCLLLTIIIYFGLRKNFLIPSQKKDIFLMIESICRSKPEKSLYKIVAKINGDVVVFGWITWVRVICLPIILVAMSFSLGNGFAIIYSIGRIFEYIIYILGIILPIYLAQIGLRVLIKKISKEILWRCTGRIALMLILISGLYRIINAFSNQVSIIEIFLKNT